MSELAAFSSEQPDLQQTDAEAAAAQLKMAREEVANVRSQLAAANARATGVPPRPAPVTPVRCQHGRLHLSSTLSRRRVPKVVGPSSPAQLCPAPEALAPQVYFPSCCRCLECRRWRLGRCR